MTDGPQFNGIALLLPNFRLEYGCTVNDLISVFTAICLATWLFREIKNAFKNIISFKWKKIKHSKLVWIVTSV